VPFKSEKQRKWMWANNPEMAKKWEKEEKKMKREQRVKELIRKIVREELAERKKLRGGTGPLTPKQSKEVGSLSNYMKKNNPFREEEEDNINEFDAKMQKNHFLNLIKQEVDSLKGQIAYAKDKVNYKGTPDWEKKEFKGVLKDLLKKLKDSEKHYKRVQKLKEGKLKEGKGVDKVLSMANDNSFGKLGGKTVDAMSANLFKTVYDKLTGSNKEKIDKMNEKQLYVFMTKLWTKFGKQVRI